MNNTSLGDDWQRVGHLEKCSEDDFQLYMVHTLTKPSTPIVINSPSSIKNCCIIPWWHDFLPFLEISTLIRPPSHSSILPQSEPDRTLPSGNSTKPVSTHINVSFRVLAYQFDSFKLLKTAVQSVFIVGRVNLSGARNLMSLLVMEVVWILFTVQEWSWKEP